MGDGGSTLRKKLDPQQPLGPRDPALIGGDLPLVVTAERYKSSSH